MTCSLKKDDKYNYRKETIQYLSQALDNNNNSNPIFYTILLSKSVIVNRPHVSINQYI